MTNVTIRDYIGSASELTAVEVRKLPIGTEVVRHNFDTRGRHQTVTGVVSTRGRAVCLARHDLHLGIVKYDIRPESDRLCYTLPEGVS